MNQDVINIISHDFSENDRDFVIGEMSTITQEHVMAGSESNLKNTLLSILKLSKGDIAELERLVECAKRDFRDVIYWASIE